MKSILVLIIHLISFSAIALADEPISSFIFERDPELSKQIDVRADQVNRILAEIPKDQGLRCTEQLVTEQKDVKKFMKNTGYKITNLRFSRSDESERIVRIKVVLTRGPSDSEQSYHGFCEVIASTDKVIGYNPSRDNTKVVR